MIKGHQRGSGNRCEKLEKYETWWVWEAAHLQINPAGGRRGFGCCGGGIGLKKGDNIRLRNSYAKVEETKSKI